MTTDTKVIDGSIAWPYGHITCIEVCLELEETRASAHEKDKKNERYNILKFTVFWKYKRVAIYTRINKLYYEMTLTNGDYESDKITNQKQSG